MDHLDLAPIRRVRGAVRLPGSKSISNRMLLLAALGGALGLLAVLALVLLGRAALPGLPIAIEPLYLLLSLALSCGVGLLAGIVPALNAANLDPIAALHSD